jgi:hypothetical protein
VGGVAGGGAVAAGAPQLAITTTNADVVTVVIGGMERDYSRALTTAASKTTDR